MLHPLGCIPNYQVELILLVYHAGWLIQCYVLRDSIKHYLQLNMTMHLTLSTDGYAADGNAHDVNRSVRLLVCSASCQARDSVTISGQNHCLHTWLFDGPKRPVIEVLGQINSQQPGGRMDWEWSSRHDQQACWERGASGTASFACTCYQRMQETHQTHFWCFQ